MFIRILGLLEQAQDPMHAASHEMDHQSDHGTLIQQGSCQAAVTSVIARLEFH